MDNNINLIEWYTDIPPITRGYFTLSAAVTIATALDLITPFSLYYNHNLIMAGQVWRLVTNFAFFGSLGVDWVFHMYFLVRYSRSLEEGSFRGRPADFLTFLLLGAFLMTLILPFVSILFMGSSLTFMMVYLWGRRNPMQRMSFLGLFPFSAPYLPWVLLGFSMLLGSGAIVVDVIGIVVGHIYFYLADALPAVAESRGWRWRKFLYTPPPLHWICGTSPTPAPQGAQVDNIDLINADPMNLNANNGNQEEQQEDPPQAAAVPDADADDAAVGDTAGGDNPHID